MKLSFFNRILILVAFFLTYICMVFGCPGCQPGYIKCHSSCKCIKLFWVLDGDKDCEDGSDEDGTISLPLIKPDTIHQERSTTAATSYQERSSTVATSNQERSTTVATSYQEIRIRVATRMKKDIYMKAVNARERLLVWFVSRRKIGSTVDKWGYQLHRTATAIYLTHPAYFFPRNNTGIEMAYELTIQLLSKLAISNEISSEELALYINALLVTCVDPRKFYGQNLVQRLREHVDAKSYANPMEMIALCNAKDSITLKDIQKVTKLYDYPYRALWTDSQALAVMALSCMSSLPDTNVDGRVIRDMSSELKKRQHLNGTVENLKTTALVVQSLMAAASFNQDFDFDAAVDTIVNKQNSDGSFGSFMESYYVLIALSMKSLVNISTSHCENAPITEEEALNKFQNQNRERISVIYSVVIGKEVDVSRTWKLKVQPESTFYDVMEVVKSLDSKYTVHYKVLDGKPYPTAVLNVQDDPERDFYWFLYKRGSASKAELQLVEASPVDITVQNNEEIILWYKYADWNNNETASEKKTTTSPIDLSPL